MKNVRISSYKMSLYEHFIITALIYDYEKWNRTKN